MERPEGEAVISVAGGTFAVTPSFVGEDRFRCGGLKIVFFFSTHTTNVNVQFVPVQLLYCNNKISSK